MSQGFYLFTAMDLYDIRELKQINQFIFHFWISGYAKPMQMNSHKCTCFAYSRALFDISFMADAQNICKTAGIKRSNRSLHELFWLNPNNNNNFPRGKKFKRKSFVRVPIYDNKK